MRVTISADFIAMLFAAAIAVSPFATPLAAEEAPIFPYATSVNPCPAGLRPVVSNGLIGCGLANRTASYQAVIAHPVRARAIAPTPSKTVPASRIAAEGPRPRLVCPVGARDCVAGQ